MHQRLRRLCLVISIRKNCQSSTLIREFWEKIQTAGPPPSSFPEKYSAQSIASIWICFCGTESVLLIFFRWRSQKLASKLVYFCSTWHILNMIFTCTIWNCKFQFDTVFRTLQFGFKKYLKIKLTLWLEIASQNSKISKKF